MLLSLDGTLVVQLVNFVVFLLILNAIFLRPVGAAIARRRAYINSVGTDIEQSEADLRELRAQAAEVVAVARREADAWIAEERARAQTEADTLLSNHQLQATSMVQEAQATVALEIKSARSDEQQIVDGLARTMLSRAVGPELTV